MPMSKAVALMRAAEKARAADRRVTEAQRALSQSSPVTNRCRPAQAC
jgi:hypothetical protein